MKSTASNVEQMELGFNGSRLNSTTPAPERRVRRASSWFERRGQVVARALAWKPAHPPRPEQIWLVPQR